MPLSFRFSLAPLLATLACAPPSASVAPPPTSVESGAFAPAAEAAVEAAEPAEPDTPDFVAHEWGTVTVKLDEAGYAQWTRADRVEALPPFVYESWISPAKQSATGILRLETPVIYFYSKQPRSVSVDVSFPGGFLTEWYPAATHADTLEQATLSWPAVELVPGPDPSYPVDGESHYYAARETEATPLRVTSSAGVQDEKLLFYRGVGTAEPKLGVGFSGPNTIVLLASSPTPRAAIVFAREDRRIGFTLVDELSGPEVVDLPALDDHVEDLHATMRQLLIEAGLYPTEAEAMLATWEDLWLEPGRRVFYIMPREQVDELLPLKIEPAPDELVRVIVSRIDLPETFPDVKL